MQWSACMTRACRQACATRSPTCISPDSHSGSRWHQPAVLKLHAWWGMTPQAGTYRKECMQERVAAPAAGAPGAAAAAVPLEALAARIAAVWARCGGEGDAGVAARSSPLALLAGLEVLVLRCGGLGLGLGFALGCLLSRVQKDSLPAHPSCFGRPGHATAGTRRTQWVCTRVLLVGLGVPFAEGSGWCSPRPAQSAHTVLHGGSTWAQARVEEVLAATAPLPAEAVAAVEHARERERRQVL